MSKSLNRATLLGNVGADPEIRYTAGNDRAVCNLRIATTSEWKDARGEKQEATQWHSCKFFGKIAEVVGQYVRKGSRVYVDGEIRYGKYTDKNGVERHTTEILVDNLLLLDHKEREREEPTASRRPAPVTPSDDFVDDDLPF